MAQRFTFRQRVLLAFISVLGPISIMLYGFTWRVKWTGIENLEKARSLPGKVLFAFWHSRLLGLCYTHRFRNIGIMVSQSFDGEWIARIVTRLGYRVFRGSASRRGAVALLEMLKDGNAGDLALTVDGPKGPVEKVKPGVITLASKSDLPIVPITCIPDRAWRLKSWDRFMIPKPFTVVTVKYGKHISISAGVNGDKSEDFSRELEKELHLLG